MHCQSTVVELCSVVAVMSWYVQAPSKTCGHYVGVVFVVEVVFVGVVVACCKGGVGGSEPLVWLLVLLWWCWQ